MMQNNYPAFRRRPGHCKRRCSQCGGQVDAAPWRIGIADHNVAEAAMLCALAEWWWLNSVKNPSVKVWDLMWRCRMFIEEKFQKSEA